MTSTPFKVIIAGGGPVGLVAAHALSKAGIDFLLLERGETTLVNIGSNIVLDMQGLRTLYQLGLHDAISTYADDLLPTICVDHNGWSLGTKWWFDLCRDQFGVLPKVISRLDLLKALVETLPSESQAKILNKKKVADVKLTTDGVEVFCEDGTSYPGSIVIGADGAYSKVRGSMRKLALETASAEVNDEECFLTTFQCLWVRIPASLAPDLPAGYTFESHGTGASTQFFIGKETGVTGLYVRLDEPTTKRVRYTKADEKAIVKKWGHILVARGVTLAEAYDQSIQSGLVPLDEGVVDHWSLDGRIVLIGDAAHKYTPSTGSGCNTGIIDVVTLMNKLNKAVIDAREESGNANASPSAAVLDKVFREYQARRYTAVVKGCAMAGGATDMSTWGSWVVWFLDRFVFPLYMVQKRFSAAGATRIAKTPVFDFIAAEELMKGKIPWVNAFPLLSSNTAGQP